MSHESKPDPSINPDGYVEHLHRFYSDQVHAYVLSMCRNGHLADDILSETFERALRFSRRDGVTHDVPIAWLKTIARNLLVDSYRRAVNRHELSQHSPPETETEEAADGEMLREESQRRVDSLLELLTPAQRLAFELCKIDGYSIAEVATLMGRSEQAVRSLTHKATRALRVRLHGVAGPTGRASADRRSTA